LSYLELLREHLKLKENLSKSLIPIGEIITFGGAELHEKLDLTTVGDNKLLLSHACIHTISSKRNGFLTKERGKEIHANIVVEMKKRSLNHLYFDKLDE